MHIIIPVIFGLAKARRVTLQVIEAEAHDKLGLFVMSVTPQYIKSINAPNSCQVLAHQPWYDASS